MCQHSQVRLPLLQEPIHHRRVSMVNQRISTQSKYLTALLHYVPDHLLRPATSASVRYCDRLVSLLLAIYRLRAIACS